jgi:16S rRNA (guanine527-N7)-methyltransferase
MFHVKHSAFLTTELQEKLKFLEWKTDDLRWKSVTDFLERVYGAGLNLVSRGDRERLVERHLLPSLEGLEFVPETGCLLDVGSGGGFPGVPLALARPGMKTALIESNERKTAFLKRVIREMDMKNVEAVRARVEELNNQYIDKYDIVTARAVSKWPELIRWTERFLKADGRWLLWKEREWRKEGDLDKLGVELIAEKKLSDGSIMVVMKKAES